MTPIGRRCAAWFPSIVLLLVPLLLPPCPAYPDGGTWAPVGELPCGPIQDVAVAGDRAYACAGNVIVVLDISSPAQPHPLGFCVTPGSANDVAVSGSYVLVADGGAGLRILDVSDPANPQEIGRWQSPEPAGHVATVDGYAYVAVPGVDASGLYTVDIHDPANPTLVSYWYVLGNLEDIGISGHYAYLASYSATSRVFDISNPALPVGIGSFPAAKSIAIEGPYAYLISGWDFDATDISSPAGPRRVGRCIIESDERCVAIHNGHALVCTDHPAMYVIDISDPTSPTAESSCSTPSTASEIAVQGDYAYVADGYHGIRVISVADPAAPAEIGSWDESYWLEDVAVSTSGYAYALCSDGSDAGLLVVDVRDPQHPVATGHLQMVLHAPHVAASEGYAYIAEWAGLHVVDARDPANPSQVAFLSLFGGPAYVDVNITVSGGYAYLAVYDKGVLIVDVSDPTNPVVVGACNPGGNETAITVSTGYAYVGYQYGYGDGAVGVIDITNPAHPFLPGYCPTSKAVYGVAAVATIVCAGCRSGGLVVIDASDPAHPVQIGRLSIRDDAYGMAASGELAYVACRDGWGLGALRVIDISHPSLPVEDAFWEMPGAALNVALTGGHVYVASRCGLFVFPQSPPYPTWIRGQVRIAGTATAIAGATVEAYSQDDLLGWAVTDLTGSYSIAGIPPGEYDLRIRQRGYLSQTQSGVIVVDGQITYVNAGLQRSGYIKGQVTERATGVNLPNATVSAYLAGEPRAQAASHNDGIYNMDTDLPPGDYVASAAKVGYLTQTKARIRVVAGQTSYVNFFLDRAVSPLMGQVRDRLTGTPLTSTPVNVYQGQTLLASTLTSPPWGIYRFESVLVPPGTYDVAASGYGCVTQMKRGIVVGQEGTTYVNFNLERVPELKGAVTDRNTGAPIIGAEVRAYQGGVLQATATTVAPWGIYAMYSYLPPGAYVVEASYPGYAAQGRKDILVEYAKTAYVNFFLQSQ